KQHPLADLFARSQQRGDRTQFRNQERDRRLTGGCRVRSDPPGWEAIMVSKSWRDRLKYAAMSAFLAWHTAPLVIAPAPRVRKAVQAVRGPVQPDPRAFPAARP